MSRFEPETVGGLTSAVPPGGKWARPRPTRPQVSWAKGMWPTLEYWRQIHNELGRLCVWERKWIMVRAYVFKLLIWRQGTSRPRRVARSVYVKEQKCPLLCFVIVSVALQPMILLTLCVCVCVCVCSIRSCSPSFPLGAGQTLNSYKPACSI